MFFEIKNIDLWNALPDELSLCGINTYQLSIMRKNRAEKKGYINRREI